MTHAVRESATGTTQTLMTNLRVSVYLTQRERVRFLNPTFSSSAW